MNTNLETPLNEGPLVFLWTACALFLIGISYYAVANLDHLFQVDRIRTLQQQQHSPTLSGISTTVVPHDPPSDQSQETVKVNSNFERLHQLIEGEQLFKDAQLSRQVLADQLGLNPSTITRIVKEQTQQSFTDYINGYRVVAAQQLLLDPQYQIFSLQSIGTEVGFKSRSAFYNAFKKQTGSTPGAFKKQHKMS